MNSLQKYLKAWQGPIEAIANVRDGDFAIGGNNDLLLGCQSAEDWNHFKSRSYGSDFCLSGRKTAQSISSKWSILNAEATILPGRHVIVASQGAMLNLPKTPGSYSLLVIGGAEIYRQSLQFCSKVYVTVSRPLVSASGADAYFDIDLLNRYFALSSSASLNDWQDLRVYDKHVLS